MTVSSEGFRFGLPMRRWQRECADKACQVRFMVMALHRRAGKTELALKRLCDAAVKNKKDLPFYLYVAPMLKQARAIAWARLKQMVQPFVMVGAASISEVDASVTFKTNGAIIRLYGADDPDAMRGIRLDGAVLDEVAQMKPEVWDDIIRPALSDRKGWCWFIGTPKGINLFSQLFFAADNRDEWDRARYTVYDTDALDADEVARMRAEMAENTFAREYLCSFDAAGDNQLLSMTDVDEAARRVCQPGTMDYAPRIMGVDPARFGDDRSVIIMRQGLSVMTPQVYRGIDNMELAGRVVSHINRWQPDAVFIDAGAGAGVIDRVRQLGYDCVEVNFGGKSNAARFVNKRTEMWYEMADAIRAGLCIPNDLSLKTELATPTYKYDAQNRIQLESKDEIRKRLPDAGSPDLADALALTFAQPVAPRTEAQRLGINVKRERDFNPYEAMR